MIPWLYSSWPTRWSKAECSHDRGTLYPPVSHPKQPTSVFEVYNKLCLRSLVHITYYTPLLPSTYTAIEFSPFWDFVSLKRCLHYSLTPARLLHPSLHRTRNASLRTTTPRLALVLHFCLPWMKSNFMGITEMKIAHHTISLRPAWNILFEKVYMGPSSSLRP